MVTYNQPLFLHSFQVKVKCTVRYRRHWWRSSGQGKNLSLDHAASTVVQTCTMQVQPLYDLCTRVGQKKCKHRCTRQLRIKKYQLMTGGVSFFKAISVKSSIFNNVYIVAIKWAIEKTGVNVDVIDGFGCWPIPIR